MVEVVVFVVVLIVVFSVGDVEDVLVEVNFVKLVGMALVVVVFFGVVVVAAVLFVVLVTIVGLPLMKT